MKIIKKVLITLVLFLSLFFNTSTIFAGNNLSTTFNANNDELTVTVKNNSDKELSDVEYNLNLPSEYTAKYEVNPDYSLSPQKETTFKVKVSKSGDNVSNNGGQGTKTFTSSKKSLDNTGLTSELTVGAIVVLFLLVGVLLYFKQRKVFIILLMAGLGTQLTPRYSLASEKIRQTENFKEHVTLLENNIPVSLDVSYLIEGDSNNNGNSSGNNGNNSGNNGVKPNDKDPKEVLVAGYAYSGKTNNVLEEKELKVFDGDKEIAVVKTDSEGYFFTHLIQDKTYTIKGEDFEVTVTAKNTGDYEHKDVVGKITLGRVQENEHMKIKFKPSIAYINEDIEYKVDGDKVTINGNFNFKADDKLILAPNHTYLTGFAFVVKNSYYMNGRTILNVMPITELESIVDDFSYNEEIDVNDMTVTLGKDVTEIKDESTSTVNNRNSGEISINDRKYEIKAKNGISGNLQIKGKVKYDIALKENRLIVEPMLDYTFRINVPSVNITPAFKKSLGIDPKEPLYKSKEPIMTLGYINVSGISVPIDVYFFMDASGKAEVNAEFNMGLSLKIGYDKEWVFKPGLKFGTSFYATGVGDFEAGPILNLPGTTIFKSVKIVEFTVKAAPVIRGKYKIGGKYEDKQFEGVSEGEFQLLGRIRGEAKLSALKFLKEPSIAKEELIEIGSSKNLSKYNESNNKKIEKNETRSNDEVYRNIIDKYKKAIKDRGIDDPRINMSAIDLSYTPVLYKLGEKRMTYGYYDINGDGQDELIIFGSQGIADIYTIDFNDGVSKLLPEKGAYGVSLHPQITKDNKVVITGTEGGNNVGFDKHIFDVYDFEKNSRSLRLLTSVEGIGTTFNRVYPNKEQMSLQDFINNYEKKYKQNIIDLSNVNKTTLIDKDTDSSENIDHVGGYSNAQLALIGRALIRGSNPTEVDELKNFDFYKEGNAYFTGLGNEASRIKVERTRNGISVSTPQYNVDGERMKYVERVKYTYEELSDAVGDGDLEIINRIITELKNIGKYKVEEFEG